MPIWVEVCIWQNFEVMCPYPTCKKHHKDDFLTCTALEWVPVSASEKEKFLDVGKEVMLGSQKQ